MSTEEGFLDIDGGKIWYKIYGADSSGIPLVVVHGGPGFSHDYMEPLNGLADERPVIFYDQTDCGNSTKSDDQSRWNVEYLGRELKQVCEALKLRRCHALGHSFASSIVISCLVEAKCEAITSLILANPMLNGQQLYDGICSAIASMPEEHCAVLTSAINSDKADNPASSPFTAEQFEKAATAIYKRFYCRLEPWPDCLYRSIEKQNISFYNHTIGQSLFNFTGLLRNYDIMDKLGGITVPVLLMWGAHECVNLDTDIVTFYNNKIPGARSVVFNESSHMAHLEETEAYLKAVSGFLRKIETGN
ncbi:MAG: proline iminopeptidase-family hydrolase [Nitrospirae bacterium]|nr:proline iminopeptidase-family hydrolase [Nitrospirota bacterium]